MCFSGKIFEDMADDDALDESNVGDFRKKASIKPVYDDDG